MDHKSLLSICIPTYNRAHYLKQCLDNIVLQFNDETIENTIEVIISDNASVDNTKEIVKSYQERFKNIKYFRNEKNLGVDENVINSVVRSNSKYCWHIGDDDLIQNGALDLIIKILSKKETSLLTVNFYPFVDIKKSLEKKVFRIDGSIKYSSSAEEFYDKGYCQGILGIFIFNKEYWLKIDKKNYEEYQSYYEFILKMIGVTCLPMAYLKTPVLFTGQDYRWNEGGTSFSILMYTKRLLLKLKDYSYSEKFITDETNHLANTLFKTVLSAKTYNLNCSFKNISTIYKEFYNYPLQVFFTTLVFFIPNSLIKVVKNINKKIKQKNV